MSNTQISLSGLHENMGEVRLVGTGETLWISLSGVQVYYLSVLASALLNL